jgi:hypothetical protein
MLSETKAPTSCSARVVKDKSRYEGHVRVGAELHVGGACPLLWLYSFSCFAHFTRAEPLRAGRNGGSPQICARQWLDDMNSRR